MQNPLTAMTFFTSLIGESCAANRLARCQHTTTTRRPITSLPKTRRNKKRPPLLSSRHVHPRAVESSDGRSIKSSERQPKGSETAKESQWCATGADQGPTERGSTCSPPHRLPPGVPLPKKSGPHSGFPPEACARTPFRNFIKAAVKLSPG